VKGLKIVQKCNYVFLEAYTSVLANVGLDPYESTSPYRSIYGRDDVVIADREMVESAAEECILEPARGNGTVALLVVGDPVCATTHTDLILRAQQMGISVEVIHNASIMGAVGSCGLQLYNFGQTISIPFFEGQWRPLSFYSRIECNRKGGMHTLCLLDIKVKEPDYETFLQNGGRGKQCFLPPRYMTVAQAAKQLLEAEVSMGSNAYDGTRTLCVGVARLGKSATTIKKFNDSSSDTTRTITIPPQKILAGTLQELANISDDEMGPPLHSLIVCGHLHEMEMNILKENLIANSQFDMDDHRAPN
jgi:diphthine methyl ester synthase